jgi:ABC-2 type transport system permease protein
MKPWMALVKREFLEHRGAFVIAPAVITAIVAIVVSIGILTNEPEFQLSIDNMPGSVQFFEAAFVAASFLWAIYLMIALLFYFSDAFHADRRNNALLFWKSMPKSDLEILGSKTLAGYTIFPLVIFGWMLVSSLVLYVFSHLVGAITVLYTAPNPIEFLNSVFQIGISALVYLALALLWYAPLFGWAAFLGTLFKRWSIPLFFVIPAIAVLLERVVNIRQLNYESRILEFITFRLEMTGEEPQNFDPEVWILQDKSASATDLIAYAFTNIDWLHMVIGWAILGLFVYLAAEYRRRLIEA